MSSEERIACKVCNAKVKVSSWERHIITIKHKKFADCPTAPKPYVDDPPRAFHCRQEPHIIKFD
jgi:hypothetical protein